VCVFGICISLKAKKKSAFREDIRAHVYNTIQHVRIKGSKREVDDLVKNERERESEEASGILANG